MDAIDDIDKSDLASPLPSEGDSASWGGTLTPALAAIQAELTAMRDARDAIHDAHDAMLEVKFRRRVHALTIRVRSRVVIVRARAFCG